MKILAGLKIHGLFAFLFTTGFLSAQHQTNRVLFIGNSYTYVNDLPQMTREAALSTGDTLIFDMSAPGGQTWQQHTTNATTLSKIAAGNWNYVVLQEQSQWPSFPIGQVQQGVYPYARKLDSLVNAKNPCAETIFYMTWGRKNGDAQNCSGWPPVCTYEGMDSLLQLRYTQMANENEALLSPVAKVWRKLRQQYPSLELYQTDESHPSPAGTYAAACTFYSIIFRKDPTLITWNSSLNATEASNIRSVAKSIVFDHLTDFNVGNFDPFAAFTSQMNGQTANFQNTSLHATTYSWDFGDGSHSSEENPVHTFTGNGPFQVTLISSHCTKSDTIVKEVSQTSGLEESNIEFLSISPNPCHDQLLIHSNKAMEKGTRITIYQINGTEIFSQELTQDSYNVTLTVSEVPEGLYFVSTNMYKSGLIRNYRLHINH